MAGYSSIFYKADQRGSSAIGDWKIFSTFNYSDLEQPIRKPFGNLQYVNDVFLTPGQEVTYKASQHFYQIVLPITGTLCYGNAESLNNYLASEEVMYLSNASGNHIVKNPYVDQNINYLHIGLKKINDDLDENKIFPLDFNKFNCLSSLSLDRADENNYACAGIFRVRTKGSYTLKNPGNGLFVYVINGSFELEDRLMEHRDGLALWNLTQIEFESLSEFSILLLLEIPVGTEHIIH